MNNYQINLAENQPNLHLVAEVLELGESLFEIALEAGNHQSSPGEEDTTYPVEELRAATGEFFTALRLLLRIEQ